MSDSTSGQQNSLKAVNDASVSLLLEEFKRLHDLYLRQRVKRGERVNFFVGLSTAIGGSIVILSQLGILDSFTLRWIGVIVLALLGMFGINIHANLVKNDINSYNYLRGIDRIRRYFIERDSDLAEYLLFPAKETEPSVLVKFRMSSVRFVIWALTSVLFSIAALLVISFFVYSIPLWLGCLSAIVVGISTLYGLYCWTIRELKKVAK